MTVAGHVELALAAAKAQRHIHIGVLIANALLLDALLWSFVLAGWGTMSNPSEFIAARPQCVAVYVTSQ